MPKIYGNTVGVGGGLPKSYVLETEDGTQKFVGVLVGEETVFTADESRDIREGKIAATEKGVVVGSKRIPSYETTRSSRGIRPGSSFSIPLSQYDKYDYTQFQCVIAKCNTSAQDSVEVDRVGIYDNIYPTNSTELLSSITKNSETKSIDLNIINNTDDTYYIHYFTFKEE